METLIENIITDFHERPLPHVVPREKKLPQLPGKIDTVIGMRRSGKTYFIYQNIKTLLQQKIPKERILYINFDDERLLPFETHQFQLITDIYYRLFPDFKNQKCYFFFDEIQNISGWEHFVRRLLDTENVQITLTGSSAKLLSKEISTTLRGRAITTEIFPFSFREMLIYEKPSIKFPAHPGSQTRALMENRIRKFLLQGGFPEVQSIDENYRVRILQEYVDVVILRDIIERHKIANVQALRAVVRHILSAPATLFSINKFYNDLKSQGLNCTKNSLYDYLNYLQDAYLVCPVQLFTRSERIRRANPPKVYLIDVGLIGAFLHQPELNWGHVLENFVYMELRRRDLKIHYYQTQDKTEVDFITTSIKGELSLYQVSLNLNDSATREREVRALEKAMQECGLKKGYIITLHHRETIKLKKGTIEVFPAWYFAESKWV